MHMKANHLTLAVSALALGTFSFATAQEEVPEQATQEQATAAETAPAAAVKIPAILTKVVESKKLSGQEEEATVAPIAAVFTDDSKYFVLAKGAESDINFTQLEVEVGKTDGHLVEIKAGLAPGDEVIVVSLDQLKFPTFGDGDAAAGACGPAGCPTTGGAKVTGANCPTDGACDLTIPVGEFFSESFDQGYDNGPGFYGSGPAYGPGFGPGPGY